MLSAIRARGARLIAWWPRQIESWREYVLSSLIGSRLLSRTTRPGLLRLAGLDLGRCYLGSGISIVGGRSVTIGDDSFVNAGCLFDASAPIELGSRVSVGHHAAFITSSHQVGDSRQRAGHRFDKGIVVGDGTWIGARATVLPGVTIGPGCLIAAGAVVTTDCEPLGLYGGVPATRLRDLDDHRVQIL